MPRKNIKNKLLELKNQKKKKRVNVDNNKENVYEKIILQDAEHDDNIDLKGVDKPRWWKDIIILVHIPYITSEFNQFEYACYKHKLIWFI